MKFYVLGYQHGTRLILVTTEEFDDLESAQAYAAKVLKSWRPFIVTEAP